NELKIPYSSVVSVVSTEEGKPAHGRLKEGDEIVSVDDVSVDDVQEVAELVRARKPGEEVVFTVTRGGQRVTVPVETVAGQDGRAQVGVLMRARFKCPCTVDISVGDVGGPSAGLMFSLGIIDKLTPGPLTGGKNIA